MTIHPLLPDILASISFPLAILEAVAEGVAQRLIQAFDAKSRLTGVQVAFSIGIAVETWANPRDGDLLVKKADAAMYLSKKIPGHAVTVAGQKSDPLPPP